jgi:hypothetical protein
MAAVPSAWDRLATLVAKTSMPLVLGISMAVALATLIDVRSFVLEPNPSQMANASFVNEAEAQPLMKKLRAEQQELRRIIEAAPQDFALKAIAGRLATIETRQTSIEQAILGNPVRAIELPLLRNDILNLREAQQHNMSTLKSTVDQVYDLNKWLLGGLAVAMIVLALTTLLNRKSHDASGGS